MCSLVEDNARKRITDKGSASDDSLEGDKKGKCTHQEIFIDVAQEGPAVQKGPDRGNSMEQNKGIKRVMCSDKGKGWSYRDKQRKWTRWTQRSRHTEGDR